MHNPTLASLCLLAGLAACGSDGGDGGGGDGGPDGPDAPPFTSGVSTLAGHAEPGAVDGPRGTARFANPVNVAVGPDGKVYVADFDNGTIRAVDAATGTTTTVVDQEGFRRPFGLAFDADGKLYVGTDNDATGAHNERSGTIWRVSLTARSASVVAENVGRARGLVALDDGRVVFSDYQAHTLNLVNPATGAVSVLAGAPGQTGTVDGTGGAARFAAPYGLAQRSDGSLVVADHDNHNLRLVTLDGTVTTYAGTGAAGYADGAMGAARFANPQGLAIAQNGDLFVSDLGNFRVRRIRGTTVETVVGSGEGGFQDDDNNLAAEVYGLEGIAASPDGAMLFIADGGRGEDVPFNRIRSAKL